jgi:hypothetical protein
MVANTGFLRGATVMLFLVIVAWPASATNVLVDYPAVASKTCFDQPTPYTHFTVDMYVTESLFSGLRAYATHWTDDAKGWAVRGDGTSSSRFVRFYLLNGGWTSATCSIGHLHAGEEFRFTASYNADTKETKCFVNGGVDGAPGPEAPTDTKPLELYEFSGPPNDVQMCVGGSNRVGDDFAFGGIRNFRLLTEALDPESLDLEPETSTETSTTMTVTTTEGTEAWPRVCGPQCRCQPFRAVPDDQKFTLNNRAACQGKAVEAGHTYFQYNRKNGRCATFDSCTFNERRCRGKCKHWKVFQQPSRQLAEPDPMQIELRPALRGSILV